MPPSSAVHLTRLTLGSTRSQIVVLLAALSLGGVGCAAPQEGTAGRAPLLWVASGSDSRLRPYDLARGRPAGPPVPLPGVPGQLLAAGPGRLLVVPAFPRRAPLIRLAGPRDSPSETGSRPGSAGASRWVPAPLALEEPVVDAVGAVAAVSAGAPAVVAYRTPASAGPGAAPGTALRCRMAWVNVASGTVARPQTICSAGEMITALALREDPAGAVAYAALWGTAPADDGAARRTGRGRLVAADERSGMILAAAPLSAPLTHLAVAGSHGDAPSLLGIAPADGCTALPCEDHLSEVLAMDPQTLNVVARHHLSLRVSRLVAAPDAHDGYALDGSGTALYRISDTASPAVRLAAFPDTGVDLVLADRWLLVATPDSGVVWRVDRLATRPAHPIRTGRFPIALAVA